MKYVISHEGQVIPVPEDIAADEGKLRRALATIIPGIAEAKVSYSDEKNGTKTITIAKQAGTKGGALEELAKHPGGKNAVIECFEELQMVDMGSISAEEAVRLDAKIGKASEKGAGQKKAIDQVFERLAQVRPQAAPVLILGF